MRVVVTGASGFIGGALVRALRGRGDEVYPVVRRVPELGEVGIDLVQRQLDTSRVPGGSLEGIDAAVHLAGAPITTRWSPKRLERIRSSRITVGNLLARSLASLERPPAVLVSGSAVGFYGDRGDEVLDETSPQGTGVLADLCRSWEQSTAPAAERGIRVVTIRTGIVLGGAGGADGGILAAEVPIFKLGLGARLGNGRQWTSWVALDDEVAVILRAIDDTRAQRSGELDGPQPGAQRRADRTPSPMRSGAGAGSLLPATILRLALGRGAADELLLASQRVLPQKLADAGYVHAYGELGTPRSRLGAATPSLTRAERSEDGARASVPGRASRQKPSVKVGAVTTNMVVHGVIGVDGLARVTPEAFLHVVVDETLGDVMVVHVGDLELAPP